MSNEKKTPAQEVGVEDLNKSINTLLREAFPDLEKGEDASFIVGDSETTADEALKKVPKSKNDKSRGAGRPKEISDVPNVDEDGARAKIYDKSIIENEDKEEENEEAKKQSKSVDQTSKEGHTEKNPKAPPIRPFKKSEDFQKSFNDFQAFKEFQKAREITPKSKVVDVAKKNIPETLNKSEDLVKSMVAAETSELRKSVEALVKTNEEQLVMLKSIGARPTQSKAITSVEAMEKAESPSLKKSEAFSKAEIADAAFELAKAGKIDGKYVTEMEMTGSIFDPAIRKMVEVTLHNRKI